MIFSQFLHGLRIFPVIQRQDLLPALLSRGRRIRQRHGPRVSPVFARRPGGGYFTSRSISAAWASPKFICKSPPCLHEARTCGVEKQFGVAEISIGGPEPTPPQRGSCLSHPPRSINTELQSTGLLGLFYLISSQPAGPQVLPLPRSLM